MEEWDLYNENGEKLGKTITRGKEMKENEYHISVHVWIVNSKGEFLIQKRSATKKKYPNMWAMTGGAVLAGETSEEACLRETYEELGINLDSRQIEKIGRIKKQNVLVDIWIAYKDCDIKSLNLSEEEVIDVKWIDKDEIIEYLKNEELASYAIAGLEMCMKYLK